MTDKPTKPKPICGARNRRGTPCQCKKLLKGAKCRFHGGMSTGPRTLEGKARCLASLRLTPNWKKHLSKAT